MGLLSVSKGYKASFTYKSICELLFMSETLDKRKSIVHQAWKPKAME